MLFFTQINKFFKIFQSKKEIIYRENNLFTNEDNNNNGLDKLKVSEIEDFEKKFELNNFEEKNQNISILEISQRSFNPFDNSYSHFEKKKRRNKFID